jgi:hypothetical protein
VIQILCRSADYSDQLRTKQQKQGFYKRLQSVELGIVSGKNLGGERDELATQDIARIDRRPSECDS